MRQINWGMIVSHHPPTQYNRTFRLCGVRFCTRCTGIFLGTVTMFFVLKEKAFDFGAFYFVFLLLPVPAVLNFSLTELGKIKNSHYQRLLTGFLLGNTVGFMVYHLFFESLFWAFISLGIILSLEISVALILHKKGKLESFFQQYEDGLYKENR